jgi:hypothetical protein
MHRILAFAGLALGLTSLPASAQMITISPVQIGEVFCIARLGNDMAPVSGLLTHGLAEAIATAEKMDAAWEAENPGEKPPLGDGIPWQTYQDYAPECTVGTVLAEGGTATVNINYAFPEAPDANFIDQLALVQVEDPLVGAPVWRLDDVIYSEGTNLRATLASAFVE